MRKLYKKCEKTCKCEKIFLSIYKKRISKNGRLHLCSRHSRKYNTNKDMC